MTVSVLSTLLLVAHFVAAAAIIVRVLLRPGMAASTRLAWIMVIEAVPLAGILAYILFGEIRMGRHAARQMTDVRELLQGRGETLGIEPARPADGPGARVFAAGLATSSLPALPGNRLVLLPEGDEALDDLVAAIDGARDHVHLLFYIWLPDGSGQRVAEAVERAARRGVACRILVDALGSRLLAASDLWRRLGAAGAETELALPFGNPLVNALFRRLDMRNHRKIAVIDNRIAFTGSRNCADMAFAIKPEYAPWIDVFFRVEGPVVAEMQAVFLMDWISYTGRDLSGVLDKVPAVAVPGVLAQVVATGADQSRGNLSQAMCTLIYGARRRLTITTPYFVPDVALLAAITAAALRGVAVTLILPERNDSRIVAAASEGSYDALLAAGVRLMLFRGGLLHAKVMTVDDELAMIGSANLDLRSFDLNYEMNLMLRDAALTAELEARQASYLARARPLGAEEVARWGVVRRVRNNLVALAAPLL